MAAEERNEVARWWRIGEAVAVREQVFEGRHFCGSRCFFGSAVSEKGDWGFSEGFFFYHRGQRCHFIYPCASILRRSPEDLWWSRTLDTVNFTPTVKMVNKKNY